MTLTDMPFIIPLILAVVTLTGTWYLRRHFSQLDRTALTRQQDSGAMLVIPSYTYKRNIFINALQNAVVIGLYGLLIHLLLAIFVMVMGLVPYYGIVPLGLDLMVGAWTLFPVFVGIGTAALWLLPRKNARMIPNFLFSKKYSLTDNIYVDQTGFDGLFLLPWSRVRQVELVGENTLQISYRRWPFFISHLISADTIVFSFTRLEEVEGILNFFHQSKEPK